MFTKSHAVTLMPFGYIITGRTDIRDWAIWSLGILSGKVYVTSQKIKLIMNLWDYCWDHPSDQD